MGRFLLFLVVLTSSFSVSLSEFSIIHTLIFVAAVGASFFRVPALGVERSVVQYFQYLLFAFAIGLFISMPVNYIADSNYRFLAINPLGRIFNLVGATAVIFYMSSSVRIANLLKWYFYSCSIIVGSALWHALDLYTSLPINFPFETRSLVHSASSIVSIEGRLTGLAQEPSYLASYLVDFWIFSLVVFHQNKRLLVIFRTLCAILVFLTYSPSAYLSFSAIIVVEMFLRVQRKNKLSVLLFSIVAILGAPILIVYFQGLNIEALTYFTDRVENAGDSGRFFVIVESIRTLVNDGSMFRLLFGNGLKSFELLQTWNPDVNVVTSNNLYVDVFFESGVIGLAILLSFYVYVLKKIKRINVFQFRIFAYLILVNLFLSGFYRADYATLRFFLLFFFVFSFIQYRRYFNVIK